MRLGGLRDLALEPDRSYGGENDRDREQNAKPVTYEEWKSRGVGERLLELFAFPIKEQL